MLTDKIDFDNVFWQGRVKFFGNVKNEISVEGVQKLVQLAQICFLNEHLFLCDTKFLFFSDVPNF